MLIARASLGAKTGSAVCGKQCWRVNALLGCFGRCCVVRARHVRATATPGWVLAKR